MIYCETTKEKALTKGTWSFSGNGGGIEEASLEDCLDCLFDRQNAGKYAGKREVREFCLKYGFFACVDGAIYARFLESYSSIDFVNLNQKSI